VRRTVHSGGRRKRGGRARRGTGTTRAGNDDRLRPQVVVMWSYCPGQMAEREGRAFAAVSSDARAIPEWIMAGRFQYFSFFKYRKPPFEVM